MEPGHLIAAVFAATLGPPLLWWVLVHLPREKRGRRRRDDAVEFVERNRGAPAWDVFDVTVDEDGNIRWRPR